MLVWNYSFTNPYNYLYDESVIDTPHKYLRLLNVGGSYDTSNPYVETQMVVYHETLLSWKTSETMIGSDDIHYILSKNNVWYYWDAVVGQWVVSDETYAQSNTSAEIAANFVSFFDNTVEKRTQLKVRIFLHSDSGATTPVLANIKIKYNFGTYIDLTHLSIYVQDEDLIRLSNDDESDNLFVYQAVVNECIERAQAVIEEHIIILYKLPLLAISDKLRLIASNLTLYYLYMRKHILPEAVMTLKKDALAQLEKMKTGDLALGLDPSLIIWQDGATQVSSYVSTEEIFYTKKRLAVF